jgi:hypothetical protein
MANIKSAANRRTDNRRRKIERLKAEQRRQEQRRRAWIGGSIGSVGVFIAGAVALAVALLPSDGPDKPNGAGTPTASSPASIPPLAPAAALTGAPVDGIESGSMEQLAFHIHAHLGIYVDGEPKAVPYGIGIIPPYQMSADAEGNPFVGGGKGIYWLHTHDASGIIHMEAPAEVKFTLGELFDMWGQPLSSSRVGPAQGALTVFVNGQTITGDPRSIRSTRMTSSSSTWAAWCRSSRIRSRRGSERRSSD